MSDKMSQLSHISQENNSFMGIVFLGVLAAASGLSSVRRQNFPAAHEHTTIQHINRIQTRNSQVH